MWLSSITSLLDTRSPRSKSSRRRANYQPRFETLEDRIVPATRIWDGGALGDNGWANAVNWVGDVRPGAGDDLVFPEAAAQKTNVNNMLVPGGFRSLTFSGDGYDISGLSINLTAGSLFTPSVASTAAAGAENTVDLNINFTGNGLHTISVAEGDQLSLTGDLGGNVALIKSGTGTTTFSGNNVYTQTTIVAQGALRAASNSALGSTAIGTQVNNGAALQLFDANINEPLSLTGTGINGTGALHGVSGTLFLGGNISLPNDATIGVDPGVQLNINGIVSGSNDLTKVGDGKLALNRANTYTGQTLVQEGAVVVHHAQALGSTAGATRVFGGAAVELEEFIPTGGEFPNILNVAEALTLTGDGGGTGALRNVSGDNTWSGTITLAGVSTIGVEAEAGPFTPDQLTISGTIRDISPRFSNELSKVGDGRLFLTASNTYKGLTSIEDGFVQIQDSQALGSTLGFTRVVAGASLELAASTAGAEEFPLNVAETLRLNGPGAGTSAALQNVRGNNTWSGPVILESQSFVGTDQFHDLTISGLVSGTGNLIKTRNGVLTLTNDNPYSGFTSVTAGTLRVLGEQPKSLVGIGNATLEGTGTVGRVFDSDGTISPGAVGHLAGTLRVSGDLVLQPNATYQVTTQNLGGSIRADQLDVTGLVSLTNAALIFAGPTGAVGEEFVIINNDGDDPVQSTFAGLPEGASLTGTDGERFTISYVGGDGNDVVLRHENTKPTFINRSVTSPINEGQTATLIGTIVDPDPLDRFFLDVNWGDGVVKTFEFGPGASGQTVNITHTYEDEDDDDTYVITVEWRDDHEFSNRAELDVTVHNVAPTVDAGRFALVRENATFVRRGQFSDPGADTWTATVDYGDGTGEQSLDLRRGSFKLKHRFAAPGIYRVTVTVHDDDGGVGKDSFVVIVLPQRRRALNHFWQALANEHDHLNREALLELALLNGKKR